MLRGILKLFKPRYALTALLIFGAWRGYSLVKSISEKLPLLQGQAEEQVLQSQQEHLSPIVAAIRRIHPGMRVLYWLVIYILLCLTSVPLIKKALAYESNLVNAVLIILYSGLGLLLAFIFAGFQFTWITAILLIMALILSAAWIIWLASELEKLRVEDTWK